MISFEAAHDAFVTWLSVLFIWIMLAWFYRDYRVDKFRQCLFAIRDELFDMGMAGDVSFRDPAYGLLRTSINGFIRYGHRLGFLWYVGAAIDYEMAKKEGIREQFSFEVRWDEGLQRYTPEVRRRLEELRRRVHEQLMQQVLLMSPVLLLALIALALPVMVISAYRQLHRLSLKALARAGKSFRLARNRLFDRADSTAFAVGC